MASRREEKERLRQARLEAEARERSEARRRLMLGYALAGILGALVVGGIVYAIVSGGGGPEGRAHIVSSQFTTTQELQPDDREGTPTDPGPLATASALPRAAEAAGCVLRSPRNEGNQHLGPDDPTPDYRSNPPTSGAHDAVPLANGAYRDVIEDQRHLLHTLEHGRVAVQYSPDLPEQAQLEIKGMIDESFLNMVLVQNDEMPYELAATAWGQLLGCDEYSAEALDAVRAFRDRYLGFGPEPLAAQPS